jgi:hypothetical protein
MPKAILLASIIGLSACGVITPLQANYYIPPPQPVYRPVYTPPPPQPVYRPVYTPPPPAYHPTYHPTPTYHSEPTHNSSPTHSYSNPQHTASGGANNPTVHHHTTTSNSKGATHGENTTSSSSHGTSTTSNTHSTHNKSVASKNHVQGGTHQQSNVTSGASATESHLGKPAVVTSPHPSNTTGALSTYRQQIAQQHLRVNPPIHDTPVAPHQLDHPFPGGSHGAFPGVGANHPFHRDPVGFPHRPIFPGPHHLSSGFVNFGPFHSRPIHPGLPQAGHGTGLVVVNGPILLPGRNSLDGVYIVPNPGDVRIVDGLPVDADGFIMDVPTSDEIAADPQQYQEGPPPDDLSQEYQQEMADPNWQGRVASDDGEDSLSAMENSSTPDGAITSDQPSGPIADSGPPPSDPSAAGPSVASSAPSSAPVDASAPPAASEASPAPEAPAPAPAAPTTAANSSQPPQWLVQLAGQTEQNDQARSAELKQENQEIGSELQQAQGTTAPAQDPTGYSEALADLSSSDAQP